MKQMINIILDSNLFRHGFTFSGMSHPDAAAVYHTRAKWIRLRARSAATSSSFRSVFAYSRMAKACVHLKIPNLYFFFSLLLVFVLCLFFCSHSLGASRQKRWEKKYICVDFFSTQNSTHIRRTAATSPTSLSSSHHSHQAQQIYYTRRIENFKTCKYNQSTPRYTRERVSVCVRRWMSAFLCVCLSSFLSILLLCAAAAAAAVRFIIILVFYFLFALVSPINANERLSNASNANWMLCQNEGFAKECKYGWMRSKKKRKKESERSKNKRRHSAYVENACRKRTHIRRKKAI